MEKPIFPLSYKGKQGGVYKSTGSISLTPSGAGGASAGSILGSFRWLDPDYSLVLQSFGIQMLTLTGLASPGMLGLVVYKAHQFTVDDTGGTDVTSYFTEKLIGAMPNLSQFSSRICSLTAPLAAGTRTLGNMVYGSAGIAPASPAVIQVGTIYPFVPGQNDPVILEYNDGLEYQLPAGITLPQGKNITVNLIGSWAKVPNEVIAAYYGASW